MRPLNKSCFGKFVLPAPALAFRLGFVMVWVLALAACSGEGAGPGQGGGAGGPAPVMVAFAVNKAAPVEIRAIGAVEPINSVEVRAQVVGLLTKVHFEEGREVKEGDLLFSIDDRPYRAAVNVARSVQNRDQAQAELARKEAAKNQELFERKYLSETENDQSRATVQALSASVRADRAALEAARLELAYCELRAPISGLTGRLKITAGNLAGPTGPALVTINQLDPIYVNFAVPEARLAEIQKHQAAGPLLVRALVPGAAGPVAGELTLIDNAVDRATGTVALRASFANPAHALWPGQFVEIVLTLAVIPDAVTVPSAAVQTGQDGQFVFVVRDDLTVEVRPVEVRFNFGDEAVIATGLEEGQRVVIDGHLRLTPGGKVEIKSGLLDSGATVP